MTRRRRRALAALAAAGFALAACGGDGAATPTTDPSSGSAPPITATDQPAATPAPTATAPTTAASTTEPAGPVPVDSLAGVRDAVVQIVATGTFQDPVAGVQANVPGAGSGFIIDPSGLAVTNNHVVTGAASLEVFLAGEETPRNARVVGVSECTDLAVIDIDGDEYPYLEWASGAMTAGTEIFAAGFPLGDPEYTVLDGIVSKENAAGDTPWASIDAAIEHSADTLPGNSGGPLVTAAGQVVAVNYAGNDLGQSFAIGLDVARPVVETLITGVDFEATGINGEVVNDGSYPGVWVYSVKSGSMADVAGVRAGDFLITMEDISLGVDGTMAAYCDILRSHTPTDTLGVQVYRIATDELLEGQLNGRPLEVITSFETEFDEVLPGDASSPQYSEYMMITDDSQLISVSVPVEWADVDGRGWETGLLAGDELAGPALSAAPDITLFRDTWGTPGVFIGASALVDLTVEQALDMFDFTASCAYDGRYDYDDGVYTGLYDLYTDCGPEGSWFFQIVAEPPDQSWIASLQIVALTDADLIALDEITATFTVAPLGG